MLPSRKHSFSVRTATLRASREGRSAWRAPGHLLERRRRAVQRSIARSAAGPSAAEQRTARHHWLASLRRRLVPASARGRPIRHRAAVRDHRPRQASPPRGGVAAPGLAERHFGEWRMGFAAMTTISKRLPVIQSTCRPVASRAQPQVRQTGYLRHFATGGFTATSRPSRLTFPVFQRVAAQLSRAGSDQTIALLGVARS